MNHSAENSLHESTDEACFLDGKKKEKEEEEKKRRFECILMNERVNTFEIVWIHERWLN